jgi:small GTP-binding protein
MPVNVNDPEYTKAEKEYHEADSLEERLNALRKMISHAPKHKGGENLRQQLTTRRKKIEQEIIRKKKSGKSTHAGIRKEDQQIVLIGFTNTGKSSLLNSLTNATPKISETEFTTTEPSIGMMKHESINMQLIENPSIGSENYNRGLTNSADTLLIIITSLDQIKEIEPFLKKATNKRIIVFNKTDLLAEKEIRKLQATLKSKYRYEFVLISAKTKKGIEEIKNKLFQSFDKIRVYTKEPAKKEKSEKPIIMSPDSTVEEVAEKILKGFAKKVVQTRIWGPSSKFAGQIVGLKHKLKDLDVVEFKTR